eukprot:6940937-Prymnesium_polylepis.1
MPFCNLSPRSHGQTPRRAHAQDSFDADRPLHAHHPSPTVLITRRRSRARAQVARHSFHARWRLALNSMRAQTCVRWRWALTGSSLRRGRRHGDAPSHGQTL